ncbi:MAG: hypothetical protein WAK55_06515, partial [Xanthobacteraceae bacterium]
MTKIEPIGADDIVAQLRLLGAHGARGEAVTYHIGALGRDTKNKTIARIAAEARRLSEAGQLVLIQRHLGVDRFE